MKKTLLLGATISLLLAVAQADPTATTAPGQATATTTQDKATQAAPKKLPFEDEIEKFEENDRKHPPSKGKVVFVGSSSIRRWKSVAKDFPDSNVLNRGFGGSQIKDATRYAHRIVTPYEPSMIVFYSGSNDIAGKKTGETVLAEYKKFVAEVRTKLPTTPIVFIAIAPSPKRWIHEENLKKANALIAEYSKTEPNLKFLDIVPLMLDEKGQPRPELFVGDRLHMNSAGYDIWIKALKPLLPLKDTAAPAK